VIKDALKRNKALVAVYQGWGNESCVVANLREWMPYNPKRHSLKNDEEFPVVV
jgi:hypothetical protein